ncbi:NADH-quinone oxidoreductase subunit C [Rickettsia endosymbiont of Cardiosporidium cionae]|uniref:NADH-quinone oxidoreductase subunit C n=1 Tax=Rickettsia endosymbiont of Cardiosporidium cionae TaxID=2777155 RepID=UPI0018952FFE|nr:NADH-quinone oxidoreductase subunit C [Rickettsia endosymbiont of Cardiosporidium cionae]KAF8818957.1 NADH-quinone oxidoreductase subunit C [Rickettsia endosymbiont of Cardiosporidium cionae]
MNKQSTKLNNLIEEFITDNSYTKLDIKNFTAYMLHKKESLIPVLNFLKLNTYTKFTILTDLFVTDFISKQERFEITYNLLSLKLNQRLILKLSTIENKYVPSIVSVFKSACWYEREAFDMFGVLFEGLTDKRRILTDYNFVGHPLRKDFPLTGHLELRYDTDLNTTIYEPVKLEQEFREFDFVSPWKGPQKSILPGDEKATKKLGND